MKLEAAKYNYILTETLPMSKMRVNYEILKLALNLYGAAIIQNKR